jgi:hypothetical protein
MSTQSNKNALTVNTGLLHRHHSNITLGIVGEQIVKKTLYDIGISAANPLLSNFTPGVETNVFQQSNLTKSYEDDYEDMPEIEDFVASTFDSDSWVNNNEELKETMNNNTSFLQSQIQLMAVTKVQILLNDLQIKHKASLLLYDEICQLFQQYISSPNFDRFAKHKSRR